MQLTRAADYAIRVMIHLAGLPPGTRVSRSELSAAAECPEQFLCKVLQNLTRAGLMNSHRGNTGGFELEELHRTASILEVVEAVEGPIRLNLCLTSDHACNRRAWCPAHDVWADAQAALRQVLKDANIADLATRAAAAQGPAIIGIDEATWN
ncbi:MAG: Rrf2 family transcriptional regulator [Candidatus Solibacter sp.]|nr:Rrf2 family transcriptional regulator [Candidatus Solibacter sp.]